MPTHMSYENKLYIHSPIPIVFSYHYIYIYISVDIHDIYLYICHTIYWKRDGCYVRLHISISEPMVRRGRNVEERNKSPIASERHGSMVSNIGNV